MSGGWDDDDDLLDAMLDDDDGGVDRPAAVADAAVGIAPPTAEAEVHNDDNAASNDAAAPLTATNPFLDDVEGVADVGEDGWGDDDDLDLDGLSLGNGSETNDVAGVEDGAEFNLPS